MKKNKFLLIILFFILILLFIIINFVTGIYKDIAFICENTGSHRGYREWFLFIHTNKWYKKSNLEIFLEQEYDNEYENRWTNYQGTSKNIFGQIVFYAHGRPGPILILPIEQLNFYIDNISTKEKKELYDIFVENNEKEVQKLVEKIINYK